MRNNQLATASKHEIDRLREIQRQTPLIKLWTKLYLVS